MRRRRTRGLLLAGIAALVAGAWLWLDYATTPRLVHGPMVQMASSDGFSIVWHMHPGRPCTLHVLGTDGREVSFSPAQADGEQLVATIKGLQPNTEYLYRLTYELPGGRVVPLTEDHTRTAPLPGRAFRFIAFGDSGDGSRAQYQLAPLLAGWQPDLVIHTGDLVYPMGRAEDYANHFYRPYSELLRRVPFYPCLGNHDVRTAEGRPFLDAFVLPRNGPAEDVPERQYWFDWGNARFIALDSNRDYPDIARMDVPWFESALASAGDRWKIVYVHEPIYTNGAKYPDAEKLLLSLAPLLDRFDVDLVLAGHNHLYERTLPLRGGRIVEHGTVYVTSGAGGAPLHRERPHAPPYFASMRAEQHSFTVVDVATGELHLRQIGLDGSVLDETRIARQAERPGSPGPTATAPATVPATAP